MRSHGSGTTDTYRMQARARARANIALVKYWGKANRQLNTPAVGSISITLDALWSDTDVCFDAAFSADELDLNGKGSSGQIARVSTFLDLLRERAGVTLRARVISHNNFPTGAGLASSASGFAALAAAASAALGLTLDARELSIIARQGSGSAARSIFGGYVEMHAGSAADGRDSFAEPLHDADHWPLNVVIALTALGEKKVGSGSGMNRSAESSPYYGSWVGTSPADLDIARHAIAARDFEKLAEVSEHSCLKMHAAAMAAQPPLLYWNAATVDGINAVRELRAGGVPVFFTIDAGPQLKAVCEPSACAEVTAALDSLSGVLSTTVSDLGPGIEWLDPQQ
jgi:diphosphomevalonate decarboxylase